MDTKHELSEFKNLGPNTPTTHIDIPEKPENRVKTDRPALIAFFAFVGLLIVFMIPTFISSDLKRLGFVDDCGNICGAKNEKDDRWSCTGQDFSDKKYLKTSLVEDSFDLSKTIKDCVYNCSYDDEINKDSKTTVLNCARSYSDANEDSEMKDMEVTSYLFTGSIILRLIVCAFIAVGVSIMVMYMFRYAVGFVVWGIIIVVFILSIIVVGIMWAYCALYGVLLCLFCTMIVAVYAFGIYYLRQSIALVIVILTETAKAVFSMPSVVVVPLTTFVVEMVVFIVFIITSIYMISSAELVEDEPEHLTYEMTEVAGFTLFLNIVVTVWSLVFINGIQYMTLAGAVSSWYFAKDKMCIAQPVKRSVSIVYKFHLGTIAFGSIILILADTFRYMVHAMTKNRILKSCLNFILAILESVLEFLTKRAYIVTAMHGQPFLKSGKRAAYLIGHNLGKVIRVTYIGNLTICVGIVLIALISMLLSKLLFLGEIDVIKASLSHLIFVIALFVGFIFFSAFQVTMDTILICFCEDCEINDGMARPYAMSKELMEFVDNYKKMLGIPQESMPVEVEYPQAV